MEAGYLAAATAAPERGRWSTFVFRSFDITTSALLLILLSPVLAIVAIAVRLDSSGPAIFRQERLGRGMVTFDVLKFRTMRTGSDSAPHREYVRTLITDAPSNAESAAHAENGGLFKLAVDDRVTRVGRFLRTWSLDELPQLWNVLRGDMSLVGPRPVIPDESVSAKWYLSASRSSLGLRAFGR